MLWLGPRLVYFLDQTNTFVTHSFSLSHQQDYASACFITKADVFLEDQSAATLPIRNSIDSRCTPQFFCLRKSSALLILSGVTV